MVCEEEEEEEEEADDEEEEEEEEGPELAVSPVERPDAPCPP